MVILIALVLVALTAVSARAAVVPAHVCQTAIDVSSTVDLEWTPDDVRRFREEAERAWTPLGVDICWRDAQTPCAHAVVTLYVRVAEDVPTADPATRRALGWIGFSDIAGPGPVHRLVPAAGHRHARSRRTGGQTTRRNSPAWWSDCCRAHWDARWHTSWDITCWRDAAHSPTGLMREAFRPEDLADPGEGQRMQLARRDARELAQRCAPRVGLTADATALAAPK